MAPKLVDWASTESYKRLLAAVVATGVKIDLKEVAMYFGTTYNSVEGRFRQIKSDAEKLKAAAKDGAGTVTLSPKKTRGTPTKSKTETLLNGVASGRVGKSSPIKGSKTNAKNRSDSDGPGTDDDDKLQPLKEEDDAV